MNGSLFFMPFVSYRLPDGFQPSSLHTKSGCFRARVVSERLRDRQLSRFHIMGVDLRVSRSEVGPVASVPLVSFRPRCVEPGSLFEPSLERGMISDSQDAGI